jgi:hypothetical protein
METGYGLMNSRQIHRKIVFLTREYPGKLLASGIPVKGIGFPHRMN